MPIKMLQVKFGEAALETIATLTYLARVFQLPGEEKLEGPDQFPALDLANIRNPEILAQAEYKRTIRDLMKTPPQQAAGYLQERRPDSRPYRVSSPERAEYANTGNGASTGELHPERLNAFMNNGYNLSVIVPLLLEHSDTGIWEEFEGYNKEEGCNENWSDYDLWLYQDTLYGIDKRFSKEQQERIAIDFTDNEQQKLERLSAKFSVDLPANIQYERTRISENVRIEVWRRDQGRCASCSSRENLEYDHIVPVSRGGSNTTRNVELLCEVCNRSKGNRIQ